MEKRESEDIFEQRRKLGKTPTGKAGSKVDISPLRSFAVATTIPFTLLAGPLFGFALGYLIQKKTDNYIFTVIFVVLGLIASIKLTIDLMRKLLS